MTELASKKDIEKISYEILKDSKSLDVFPTPVDQIISHAELVVANDIDISTIHEGYLSKVPSLLNNLLRKVRGLIDRKENIIYLDLSQSVHRKSFVKLHEAGHKVLPWQQSICDVLDDDDESLSPHTREEFEAEANFFASATLFQHDRFVTEMKKYDLGISSAMQLSKYFGASVHATLRRYVEQSKKRCALIVLENISPKGTQVKCLLKDLFMSEKFAEHFGELGIPNELGYKWAFVKDYYFKKKFHQDGEIPLVTLNGEVNFSYHFFNNGHNAFVFLFPKGERQKARTKVIITT